MRQDLQASGWGIYIYMYMLGSATLGTLAPSEASVGGVAYVGAPSEQILFLPREATLPPPLGGVGGGKRSYHKI